MRDYSKVSAQFWVGKTGRALSGDMQTQVVAMYLMTSPHANMIGVFIRHLPVWSGDHSPVGRINEEQPPLIAGPCI